MTWLSRAVRSVAIVFVLVFAAACSPASNTSGAVTVSDAWAQATPPGATTGAGYLQISNGTGKAVRLMGGASPVADAVEVHSMSMDGAVMRMRQLTEGVDVPAGGSIVLAPGGLHLMLVGLKAPLVEGQSVPLTLTFDGHAAIEVTLAVKRVGGGHEH